MSTAALSSRSQSASLTPTETLGESIRRYSNLAATLAIVFAVTIGGWFAMSQLPPGGDGRFAALQATPEVAESATCDVEPLTVDQVMAIVENPYSVAPLDSWGTPAPGREEGASLAGEGHREVGLTVVMPEKLSTIPADGEFEKIRDVAESHFACEQAGTMGQRLALMHPEMVQNFILSGFPVYRDQAEVRAYVEDILERPSRGESPAVGMDTGTDYQSTFPTAEKSRVRIGDARGHSLLGDSVAWVGLDMRDEDGNVVGETDWDATILEGDMQSNNGGYSLILVYSEAVDSWYFYGFHAPRG